MSKITIEEVEYERLSIMKVTYEDGAVKLPRPSRRGLKHYPWGDEQRAIIDSIYMVFDLEDRVENSDNVTAERMVRILYPELYDDVESFYINKNGKSCDFKRLVLNRRDKSIRGKLPKDGKRGKRGEQVGFSGYIPDAIEQTIMRYTRKFG